MDALMIGNNIRKLREERKMTQQQLADVIGISFQAVSKWECGTTVPDIGLLPSIAEFFEISIDELFKESMSVYKNKAQRLMALYESDRQNSDTFEKADKEYNRIFESGDFDADDLGYYSYLNECRYRFFAEKAEQYYLEAIKQGEVLKNSQYYKNQRQYILFLSRMGRGDESIKHHIEVLRKEPDHPMNYASLVSAYKCTNQLEKAFEVAEEGLTLFPNEPILLVYAGDTCKRINKIEKAIEYWDKAFEIDPDMIDTRYSLADYYIEQGKKDEAAFVLEQIIGWNSQRGYTIENKWVKSELRKMREA